jgi:5-(carboxyamino)imidazole ribonucleotide synthase
MTTQRAVITLGNGQLGLMLGKAAKKLGIPFTALSLSDAWAWLNDSGHSVDLVTFEQEFVDETLLAAVQAKGIPSFPSWSNFLLLKSKRAQKKFLAEGAVLKAGQGGYDGKGVWVLDAQGRTKSGQHARELLPQIREAYLEQRIDFDCEVAAVVCRSASGQVELYPTVRSIQSDGICFQVEYTQEFSANPSSLKAGEIARQIAEKLQYVGVLAVECFVKGDTVQVNEIAPRVHNSGHFTIDVCAGSQFENHLRAGLGMDLAPSKPTHPAALMVNLLWPAAEKDFAPLFTRLTCGPEWPENAKLHWYGKLEARPNRKMGHFTVYGNSLAECRSTAEQLLASRWSKG